MNAWLARSIGRKLLASFLAIFCLTYLLTAIFVYTSVRNSMTRATADTLTYLATRSIESAATRLEGVAINLHAWSHLDVMTDLISGDLDKRVARTLANLKTQYGLSGEIYAFDAQDNLVASSASAALNARLPAIWAGKESAALLIDKHLHPLTREPVLALSIAMNANFSTDFKMGTLVVTLPWPAVEAMLDGGKQRIVLYKASPPLLLSSGAGALSVAPAELQALADQVAEPSIAARRYVAGYSHADPALLKDWRVAALTEARIADQPIQAVAIKLAGLGLLLALPMLLAIRWLSRRLTEPVQSLTRVVSDITRSGDLSRRARVATEDELGTLALAFNGMAENLQSSSRERERFVAELEMLNKTLEQRVQERTRALELANAEVSGAFANLKAAQSQLVQSEKMASLGQLVAGVAHELNNPIGFIYANFPHLEQNIHHLLTLIAVLRSVPMDAAQSEAIEREIAAIDLAFIEEDTLKIIRSGKSGAARIKDIVSSLRSFSRLDEAELKSVLLEDGINDTLALLHHHIKNRIEVSHDYRLNEPVMCRAGQINQVFMNIIYNALQAIDGPGRLQIGTRRQGEHAIVTIADSGKGIPPDIIGKIFDPFFTTKRIGEGTGLGLSISYGIVEKHGGHIEVSSQSGAGTRFTITIRMKQDASDVRHKE